MPQRIAAAIAFVLALFAAPPDAAAPRPAARLAWDLFAAERLLAAPDAQELFARQGELGPLPDSSASLHATPEPGTSALVLLGLALLSGRSPRRPRARVIAPRASRGPLPAASDPTDRRGR